MLLGWTVFLRPSLRRSRTSCVLVGILAPLPQNHGSPAESPRWQRHARRIDSLHHEACPRSTSRRFDRPYMARSVFDQSHSIAPIRGSAGPVVHRSQRRACRVQIATSRAWRGSKVFLSDVPMLPSQTRLVHAPIQVVEPSAVERARTALRPKQ